MRAWGQSVVLSIAIIAAAVELNAQEPKSSPSKQNLHTSTNSAGKSITSAKKVDEPGVLNRDTTFDLLTEAYNSSRDLPSEQRIPLLSEICDTSASINFGRSHMAGAFHGARVRIKKATKPSVAALTAKQGDKFRGWTEELFRLGDEFPEGSQLRSEAEIAAARSMVSIDPKRAMELLDSLDTGHRADAHDSSWTVVSALFNRLYDTDGASAFPDIRREALSLGDRGAYPYIAVLNLFNHVYDQPDVTRQFFSDAVDYFRRGNSRTQIYGVMSLLASDEIRKQLQPWQVQDAAARIVARVKDYVRSQSEDQSDSEPVEPNISAILWFVELTMKRFAPETAAELPDPATVPPGNGYLLAVNANTHRKTPVAPVADDSLESLKKAFESSRTAMMKMGENDIHEGPEMQQTIDRTIALGAEWVERTVQGYAPEDHAYAMVVSTPELAGVARLGAHINPAATLAAIRQVQDDELKTKLLLSVARTIEYMR